MAIGTLLDIAAYHLHPVCAGYLRHVGYAQGRVSPRYDPSGCSRSGISWCYDRRSGATGGTATGALHLYLWRGKPCKDYYHLAERYVHRDGEAERRCKQQR